MDKEGLNLHKQKQKVTEDVEKQVGRLLESINIMGYDEEVKQGFLTGLLKSHPTLVQCFMRTLKGVSEDIAQKGYFKDDMRAHGSYLLFTEIAESETVIPYI